MIERFREQLEEALAPAFTIEREMAGGGMSRVFVALEHALGRTVVVKVLRPDLAAGVNRERFRREIMLAAQLHHPHIVPLLSAGERGDLIWYTMPFVEGESLREALARRGPFTARDTVRVLHDVLDALSYAHQRGVIHRDIKPGNILTHGSHALVTDFGVAKALSAAMPTSGTTSGGIAIGTPAYMSPEQLAADPHADHRMDLYATGLLAYELLSAEQPFSESSPAATMAAQLTRMPKPLEQVRPDVPAPLADLITRLLAKHPDHRPPTAAAALAELEDLVTPQGGVLASTSSLTPPSPRPAATGTPPAPAPPVRRFSRRTVFASAGVIVAAIASLLVFASDNPPGPQSRADSSAGGIPPSGTAARASVPDSSRGAVPAPPPAPIAPPATTTPAPNEKSRTAPAGTTAPAAGARVGGDTTRTRAVATRTGAQTTGGKAPVQAAAPATPSGRSTAAPRAAPSPRPTFDRPRRVAILPVRDATTRDLATLVRSMEDSLKSAIAAAGYTLASDADLLRLLSANDMNAQRTVAEGMGVGAIVTTILTLRGDEILAQSIVLDVWRAMPQSVRDEGELADPTGALGVVRDVVRAAGRVMWRQRGDPHRIVVFDLENQTGSDSLTALARAYTDTLRRVVTTRASGEVVGDSAIRATRGTTERRDAGQRVGAAAIVAGILSRRGADSLRVRLTVRDLTEERTFETVEVVAPMAAPFSALPALLEKFVADLGRVNWGPKGITR